MNIQYQDRIDDYVLGRMSATDRKLFEEQVAADPELADQLKYTQQLQAAIKSRKQKVDMMEEWANEESDEESTTSSTPAFRKKLYWVSGIAAILLIGFFFFNHLVLDEGANNVAQTTPNEDLSNIHLKSSQNVVRGGKNNDAIDSLIAKGQYDQALDKLQQFENELISSLPPKSQAILNSPKAAEDGLPDKPSDNKDISSDISEEEAYELALVEEQIDEFDWKRLQIYLKQNRKDDVLKLLDKIRKSESIYNQEADELYKRIAK